MGDEVPSWICLRVLSTRRLDFGRSGMDSWEAREMYSGLQSCDESTGEASPMVFV